MSGTNTAGSAAYGIPAPGYRLPPDTRPGRVRLQVGELERSLGWYTEVLGLSVLEREHGWAALGPQGEGAVLIELQERPGALPVAERSRTGLYHLAILLPGRAALGSFAQHLADLGERAGASDHLVSEALYLRDPDGLGIEVYADRPRAEWRQRHGELLMATEPLDIAGVLGAAAGETWAGMPPGAVLGHVHLHVGDLEAASGFYHEALGLDQVVWSYRGALFLSAGGYHHHLGVNTWARGAAPPGEADAQLLEWELLLPSTADVQQAGESLRAAGYAIDSGAGEVVVRDPWGTQLRIREDSAG